jgi:hypothetical protein
MMMMMMMGRRRLYSQQHCAVNEDEAGKGRGRRSWLRRRA